MHDLRCTVLGPQGLWVGPLRSWAGIVAAGTPFCAPAPRGGLRALTHVLTQHKEQQ